MRKVLVGFNGTFVYLCGGKASFGFNGISVDFCGGFFGILVGCRRIFQRVSGQPPRRIVLEFFSVGVLGFFGGFFVKPFLGFVEIPSVGLLGIF